MKFAKLLLLLTIALPSVGLAETTPGQAKGQLTQHEVIRLFVSSLPSLSISEDTNPFEKRGKSALELYVDFLETREVEGNEAAVRHEGFCGFETRPNGERYEACSVAVSGVYVAPTKVCKEEDLDDASCFVWNHLIFAFEIDRSSGKAKIKNNSVRLDYAG